MKSIIKLTAQSTGHEMYYNVDNIVCFVKRDGETGTIVCDVTRDEISVIETPEQILELINILNP